MKCIILGSINGFNKLNISCLFKRPSHCSLLKKCIFTTLKLPVYMKYKIKKCD